MNIPIAGCDNCAFSKECNVGWYGQRCVFEDEIRSIFGRTVELFNVKGTLGLCQVGQWVYAVKKSFVEAAG